MSTPDPSPPASIDVVSLASRLEAGSLTLMDVRLAEDHGAERIPGAKHNTIFEVGFEERMAEAVPDKASFLCVYGWSAGSSESRVAAEKLTRCGYGNVLDFRDGLEGWKSEGLPVDTGPTVAEPDAPADGTLPLDLEESRLEWLGRNLLNKHWGSIRLRSGEVTLRDGQLGSGRVAIDMNDIQCHDLAGNELHDVLIAHLQSDDFFDVERYPEAVFEWEKAEAVPGAGPGAPNHRVNGCLTLRGVTKPIVFDLAGGITPEGRWAAQAAFAIDRTEWGVIYGSGKHFRRLAGHLVNDEIELQVRMVTA